MKTQKLTHKFVGSGTQNIISNCKKKKKYIYIYILLIYILNIFFSFQLIILYFNSAQDM